VAEEQVPEVQAPARPAQHAKYPWPSPADSSVLGKPTSRIDGAAKVSGRAKYTYDINRPGMLHGRILRSPHAHARLVSLDLSAAKAAPGVKAVLGVLEPGKKAMYQGDEIAAVAAVTEQQANDAVRLIKAEFEVLPHLALESLALRPDAPAVFEGGNIKEGNVEQTGDLEAGFKAAAHVIEATYSTQVQTHVCLETKGTVCEWEGDKLTAWFSTHSVHGSLEGLAVGLGIPQANVRVICDYMGGGFGS
jgi:xanthine dehydrogenase YagR molybdenum-binding subunit